MKRSIGIAVSGVLAAASIWAAASAQTPETWQWAQSSAWTRTSAGFVGKAGKGKDAVTRSWLRTSRPYQDFGLTASFRCVPSCDAQIVVATAKSGDTTRALLLSLHEGAVAFAQASLDASGAPVNVEAVTPSIVLGRHSASETYALPANVSLEQIFPKPSLRPGQWNELEVYVSGDVLSGKINGADIPSIAIDKAFAARYAPLALRVVSNQIEMQHVAVEDTLPRPRIEPPKTAPEFRRVQISDAYLAESVTFADVNRDGIQDVIAGPNYYLGPNYDVPHEIFLGPSYTPTSYTVTLNSHAADFTGDGWPDLLQVGEPGNPAYLYVNPRGESRRWDRYEVVPAVDNESSIVADIDGDGVQEFVVGAGGRIIYYKPDPANPTAPWVAHVISEKGEWGQKYTHGLGVGDVNGDGRPDILTIFGWWEQPRPGVQGPWPFHKAEFAPLHPRGFGSGGAQIQVYDVNGDGLPDVITSLSAHGWGLAWNEQKRDSAGNISFERHLIMGDHGSPAEGGVAFSELHALELADIDGDGLKDIVTGKRWWAHFDSTLDPEPNAPPVVYWFKLERRPGGQVKFVPHLIDNRSGVGCQIAVGDLNQDGHVDVLTSTRRGTFLFLGQGTAKQP